MAFLRAGSGAVAAAPSMPVEEAPAEHRGAMAKRRRHPRIGCQEWLWHCAFLGCGVWCGAIGCTISWLWLVLNLVGTDYIDDLAGQFQSRWNTTFRIAGRNYLNRR